jgi:integrase
VRWLLVPRNVAEAATPPRQTRPEIAALSEEQVRSLLQVARGDALEAFWVLAVTTGMRNGELLALQWRDVDLEARTLRVRRSVFNGAVSSPKTAAGNRMIRLTGMAEAALKGHHLATAKRQISEWVFPSRAGTPLSVHNVYRRAWKPLLLRAGLPPTTRMHDLRHTCATLLLSRGVPVKVVSEMLGHASVSITLDTYSHVLPDMQESAARAMDEALRRCDGAPE